MMQFTTGARTDRGRVRPQNEDAFLLDLPLFAVADGMGGHKAGEIASSLALEVLASWKERLAAEPDAEARGRLLRDAIEDANSTILARGRSDEELQGMGTTLTVGWAEEGTLTLAHVGDSRAYLLRGRRLSRLTEDHTVINQWEKEGKIGPGEAAHHPHRHILLQAVGSGTELDTDVTSVELEPGDRLLLSSDGLHGMLSEERMKELLLARDADPDDLCARLIEAANEAGGDDNITVVVVDATDPDGGGAARGGEDDDEDATNPIIVSRPARQPGRQTRGTLPRVGRGAILGIVLVGLAATVAGFMILRTGDTSYVVATSDDNVALLRGRPGRGEEPAKGEVVHLYRDEPLDTFPRTVQRDLRSGIRVGSPAEADRVLAALPRVLGPDATPSPVPADAGDGATPDAGGEDAAP